MAIENELQKIKAPVYHNTNRNILHSSRKCNHINNSGALDNKHRSRSKRCDDIQYDYYKNLEKSATTQMTLSNSDKENNLSSKSTVKLLKNGYEHSKSFNHANISRSKNLYFEPSAIKNVSYNIREENPKRVIKSKSNTHFYSKDIHMKHGDERESRYIFITY